MADETEARPSDDALERIKRMGHYVQDGTMREHMEREEEFNVLYARQHDIHRVRIIAASMEKGDPILRLTVEFDGRQMPMRVMSARTPALMLELKQMANRLAVERGKNAEPTDLIGCTLRLTENISNKMPKLEIERGSPPPK